MPASLQLSATQAGGLRHINKLPGSWGRSPTCPGIFSHLLRHYQPGYFRVDTVGVKIRCRIGTSTNNSSTIIALHNRMEIIRAGSR
jgi:hypothetical protein